MSQSVHIRPVITVFNLFSGEESVYTNICPIEALISEHLLTSRNASQVSNLCMREVVRGKIRWTTSEVCSIGDLCVNVYTEKPKLSPTTRKIANQIMEKEK